MVLTATIYLGTRIYAKNIVCDTHTLRSPWDFDPIPYHLAQNEAKGLIISIGTGTLNQFKVAQPWATRPPDGWHNIFRIVKYLQKVPHKFLEALRGTSAIPAADHLFQERGEDEVSF